MDLQILYNSTKSSGRFPGWEEPEPKPRVVEVCGDMKDRDDFPPSGILRAPMGREHCWQQGQGSKAGRRS